MRKTIITEEKARCYSKDKTYFCMMYTDNTLDMEEDHWREGGTILGPDNYDNAEDYLNHFDSVFNAYKTYCEEYANNIINMLKKFGFTLKTWKKYIRASADFIWEKREKMTIEEIEKKLGYKIELVK